MSEWMAHLVRSFADQAAIWFVGIVFALLGIFSGKLVETVKFAMNRADLRSKYYEEMAIEMSRFVFIIDRLSKVYYGSTWAGDEDRSAIANEYNEAMHEISRKEYVYLSWLGRYWGKDMVEAFAFAMDRIRSVDAVLIRLNESGDNPEEIGNLETAYRDLRQAVHSLLASKS